MYRNQNHISKLNLKFTYRVATYSFIQYPSSFIIIFYISEYIIYHIPSLCDILNRVEDERTSVIFLQQRNNAYTYRDLGKYYFTFAHVKILHENHLLIYCVILIPTHSNKYIYVCVLFSIAVNSNQGH